MSEIGEDLLIYFFWSLSLYLFICLSVHLSVYLLYGKQEMCQCSSPLQLE